MVDHEELPIGPVAKCPHGVPTEAVPTGCEGPGWYVSMADCDVCDGEPCSAPYRKAPPRGRAYTFDTDTLDTLRQLPQPPQDDE